MIKLKNKNFSLFGIVIIEIQFLSTLNTTFSIIISRTDEVTAALEDKFWTEIPYMNSDHFLAPPHIIQFIEHIIK